MYANVVEASVCPNSSLIQSRGTPFGELTEEDYKEIEEILNDPSNFISDIIPETQPTVQPSSDCGTCIASDCDGCFSMASDCGYCNIQ